MEAGKRTLNEIFNGNRKLKIPFFQRSYVWSDKQWERFLSDMEMISDKNVPYFLGSLILKQEGTDSNSDIGDCRTLVDGQQRLTTLNIFFKVLYLKSNMNEKFNRLFRLDIKDEPLVIEHNYNDIDSFCKILSLTSLEEVDAKKNNIYGAYEFFRKNINIDKIDEQKIKNRIIFIGIDLSYNDDEQQIFDTINSLGVRLTTAELLKNYFFSDKSDIDKFESFWKNIFESDEKKLFWDKVVTTRTMIDLFFYSFLQIKIHQSEYNVSSSDKKDFTKVDTLFDSYKKFISAYDVDKKSLLKEIKEYSILFTKIDFDSVNRSLNKKNGLERINNIIFGLEQSTLIPYVLYILKNVSDIAEQEEMFGYLESYIMRRTIVRSSTKNYNSLFIQLISENINSKNKLKEYIKKQDGNTNQMPSDNELMDGFNNLHLVNSQALGILYMLESKIRDPDKHSTQLLGMSKYSLEHLMPKKWEENWDPVQDVDLRNKKLLTLGNLAIITQPLNSSLKNSEWEVKKSGKHDNGLNKYSTGIETLEPYLKLDNWNEQEITKRANELYEKAIEIWSI